MKSKSLFICLLIIILSDVNISACTTFIISGKVTPDGKPILFKNRDTDVMENSLFYFTDGKYDYIGLVTDGYGWDKAVWGGYNNVGFAIINTAAYNNNTGDLSKLVDREGILMKLALKSCRTLADFEKLLDSLPKPLGVDANFGVIDAHGGAAYYETGNHRYIKYDVNDPVVAPEGFLVRTNHSFSGDMETGRGFCRYNTATLALKEAVAGKQFAPEYLFDHLSRNLTHSLTKTDLWKEMPEGDEPDFHFFIDFIPRRSTASAIMVVGAEDEKHVKNVVMWTILGFPLTSVAIPVWIEGGCKLPEAVTMKADRHSPICDAAMKMKQDCFPLTRDDGKNYINLTAVINSNNTGYLQRLKPIENEIFSEANKLKAGLDNDQKTKSDIQTFYLWIDTYLADSYQNILGIKLFE